MSTDSDIQAGAVAAAEPVTAAAPAGNPGLIGLPSFLVGGITLALWLLGYLPADLPGGMIAAVFWPAGLGLLIASIWAARLGQSAVAGIFGVFATFWLSFGFLLMGLVNGWFGVSATNPTLAASQVQSIQATYLISWLAVFIVLTLATLRLPLAFTAMFAFVDIAFALVLGGVLNGAATLLTIGGIVLLGALLVGIYLYVDGMGQELGGRAMPLGNAMIK